MAFTKMKIIKKTRKDHNCIGCGKFIPKHSTCSYGVTTARDCLIHGKDIDYGHFCQTCRELGEIE
jgi:hypothetical protein